MMRPLSRIDRLCAFSAPRERQTGRRECQQREGRRLWNGRVCKGSGAAAGGLTEVSAPQLVVASIDRAARIAVGGQTCACLAERVAPHNIVGRIDAAVVVVVARQWLWHERVDVCRNPG